MPVTFLETTITTAGIFTKVGEIATGMYGLVSQVIETIFESPVLTFTFVLPFALLGIKVLKKLISTRL